MLINKSYYVAQSRRISPRKKEERKKKIVSLRNWKYCRKKGVHFATARWCSHGYRAWWRVRRDKKKAKQKKISQAIFDRVLEKTTISKTRLA
jgi:hypothetical protein